MFPSLSTELIVQSFVTEYVPRQTIPILKKFAAHIEIRTRVSVNLRAGDKKADIVEK